MATRPGFQRARSPEHKEQRRDAILAAARKLGARDGVRSVSVTDIAAEVGIHKSAVLRYFETREEIYLDLTAEGWRAWAAALHDVLDGVPSATADELAVALSGTLAERPFFCELLSHASLNLERGVSKESVRAFKLTALDAVADIRALITRVRPRSDGMELISAVVAFAASLWQVSHPPETLAQLYAEDPRLAHAVVDFRPRLELLTRAVILGLARSGGDREVGAGVAHDHEGAGEGQCG
jgi:AcrR family transcriptional regulator